MIRRIRTHAAKQDWFAVAIDLAIVVIGVFLGIQASNWNQDRQDRAEARQLRSQIIDNLKANEADLTARSKYYGQVQKHAIAALESLDGTHQADDETFVVNAYQASQIWRRPFDRTAFDEWANSGGLGRKIGDAQVRGAISAYSVTANGFEATGLGASTFREKLRRSMDFKTQDRIRNECGDRMQALPSGGEFPVLPETCQLGMTKTDVERAAARVRSIPEIEQELTRLIVDIDQKRALFDRMLRDARELRSRLERPDG